MTEPGPIEDCATFDRANELLRYEPETGLFYWKVSLNNKAKAGTEAGTLHSKSYIKIKIDGKKYRAHRVAHLLMTGHWPEGNPEHENRIRHDNRWENIKDLATVYENGGNQGRQSNNRSGLKGVLWYKKTKKWLAHIGCFGKQIHLGYFEDLRLAGLTYDAAAKLVWGPRFSCLNFLPWESDHIVLSPRAVSLIESLMGVREAA
jgi:hypothetical protein